jgi:flagellar hook-associated protein 3 FlgL
LRQVEVGARQQGIDILQTRLEDELIELQAALSEEIDVDLVEAISSLTARQAAFEASLRVIGQIFRLSLLDFL